MAEIKNDSEKITVGKRLRETLMQRPGMTAGSAGALGGAALVFLLNAQQADTQQDTAVQMSLAEIQRQNTQILKNQTQMGADVQRLADRVTIIENRQEDIRSDQRDQRREQKDIEAGQHKLRADVQEWLHQSVSFAPIPAGGYIAETAREILKLTAEGQEDIWIDRGAPYADVAVLSRRLNRRVTADERDQAAALISTARALTR